MREWTLDALGMTPEERASATLTMTAFLQARLGEDEATALAAKRPGSWVADGSEVTTSHHPTDRVVDYAYEGSAEHIARHDPERVLIEVAAKRLILNWFDVAQDRNIPADGWFLLKQAVMALAAIYQHHPDYREEWRPA